MLLPTPRNVHCPHFLGSRKVTSRSVDSIQGSAFLHGIFHLLPDLSVRSGCPSRPPLSLRRPTSQHFSAFTPPLQNPSRLWRTCAMMCPVLVVSAMMSRLSYHAKRRACFFRHYKLFQFLRPLRERSFLVLLLSNPSVYTDITGWKTEPPVASTRIPLARPANNGNRRPKGLSSHKEMTGPLLVTRTGRSREVWVSNAGSGKKPIRDKISDNCGRRSLGGASKYSFNLMHETTTLARTLSSASLDFSNKNACDTILTAFA
jgi:hypothetical protein